MAKEILKDGILYGLIVHGNAIKEGLQFYTEDKSFLQVGSWKYKKGKVLNPHAHLICERKSNLTQEFVYVKKGSIEVKIYDQNDEVIKQEILKAGDFIILFAGGHSYKILEDTEVIEVKNGPYPGIEKDKRVMEEK